MFKHILVPTDGGPLSRKAAQTAVKLAKEVGARVTGFYAAAPFNPVVYDGYVPPDLLSPEDHKKTQAKLAARYLEAIGKLATASGVAFAGRQAEAALPWQAIIAAARKNRCDLIVMASHGRRGIAGLLLGSETLKVLTHSKIPVLAVR